MKGSLQETLGRVRPPRVQIVYDVEIGDAIELRELPFIVGILADLSGNFKNPLPPVRERSFEMIDRENFNEVMKKVAPRLVLHVPNALNTVIEAPTGNSDGTSPRYRGGKADRSSDNTPGEKDSKVTDQGEVDEMMNVELAFHSIDDFYPTAIVRQVDALDTLYRERCHLGGLLGKLDGNDLLCRLLNEVVADATKQKALKAAFDGKTDKEIAELEVDQTIQAIIDDGGMALDAAQVPFAKILLGAFTTGVIGEGISRDEGKTEHQDCVARISDRVAVIDKILSRQMDFILHDPDFQRLEGSWRGLHYFVLNTETSTRLKLKLLNISKEDLLKDLNKAVTFDQSALFKMIYENEYGTYGGEPYSVLLGDYEIGRHPGDMRFLNLIGQVAAAAHAPFIINAYAKLFDLTDLAALQKPRELSKIFESQELNKWRRFREMEDSRYVSLTLPRVLMRLPYGPDTNPVEGFNFQETVNGGDTKSFLWSGAAYVLAQRITNASSLYSWTAAIRGVEGGGLVEGLPAYTFKTHQGDIALTCPTEISITDRGEKELDDLGFMAICRGKERDNAAFFGGQTTNLPRKHNADEANANSPSSSTLPYLLVASRFVHYVKVIMRDKIGSFMTRSSVEDYLNAWISDYVLLDDSPPQAVKARYPLRQARVVVSDLPGKPGSYRATVYLKPHFQLEELPTSIRLVAELPS